MPDLPPGSLPSQLSCPASKHLAFMRGCGLGSRKSAFPKKVEALAQLGQSAQSPFCVILGSLPSLFLDCSWTWDGLCIFHVSWSGVGGDLGAEQVTYAHNHQDLLRADITPRACLLLPLTLGSGWGIYGNV